MVVLNISLAILKRYSTEYNVDQKKLAGEYKSYEIDFRHPYIEIDNNKCILCARCVRICKEVVGANALGLVDRGYNTFVAPSMGDSLQDTSCESCGLCISTCPTGAITENVLFKPGPVKLDNAPTICNYCSIGCEIDLRHKNQFVMKVEGADGQINKFGNLCKYPKFGYQYLNDNSRITKPLLKVDGKFEEITFKEAYKLIEKNIKTVKPDENAFFAGARLTNEELYLIQKFARAAVKTNNINSFHYFNRGDGYMFNSLDNVPFGEIAGASKIYLIGSEINADNAVAGFMVNNAQFKNNIPVELVTNKVNSSMSHKVDSEIQIKSYYYFIKAVNYYLTANNFHNALFINDNCEEFESYKESLLKENFVELVEKSGVQFMDQIIEFAKEFNNHMNAIIVFSEKELSANCCKELFNLALITGKLGKTSSGLISLKEKNNSQGLYDMGINPVIGVGTQSVFDNSFKSKMENIWKTNISAKAEKFTIDLLDTGKLKNLFIFGEDPIGSTDEKLDWINIADFVVVQDYFLTDTAKEADLILPASLPVESGGSFTNTQKYFQEFDATFNSKVERLSHQQISDLIKAFSIENPENIIDVRMEAMSLLSTEDVKVKYSFTYTKKHNDKRIFNYGCDALHNRFEKEFEDSFIDKK